jgi:hypothetical protein
MTELKADAQPEVSSEELRWRMEKVVDYAKVSGEGLAFEAVQFNKALATLRQGDAEPDVNSRESVSGS